MTHLQSILLGLVQGLGEFLPISSSAHLVLLPWVGDFQDPGLSFDVALHLGTLLAVLAYFWKDWWQIFQGTYHHFLTQEQGKKNARKQQFDLLIKLVVATLPAILAGLLLEDWAEQSFRSPLLVGINLIVFGVFLMMADHKKGNENDLHDISFKIALAIGLAQALAIFPGVSRSGITITMALALGIRRSPAARFSFLLSTPIIFGACVLKYKYLIDAFTSPTEILGILSAAVFGFLSIKYLMKLIQNHSFDVFCWYRFVLGSGIILFYFLR